MRGRMPTLFDHLKSIACRLGLRQPGRSRAMSRKAAARRLIADAVALLDRAELYFIASRQVAATDLPVDAKVSVDAGDRAYLDGVRVAREAQALLERARLLIEDLPTSELDFEEPEVVEIQRILLGWDDPNVRTVWTDFVGRPAAIDAIEQVRSLRAALLQSEARVASQ